MKFILSTFAVFLFACGTAPASAPATKSTEIASDVTQVIYFHGKQRCITCNEIERLSKEVVDSLNNEKIIMTIVDISTPEGEQIADGYQVTWSSLFVEKDGTAENLTDMGFSYAKGQPEVFKAKLVNSIKKI